MAPSPQIIEYRLNNRVRLFLQKLNQSSNVPRDGFGFGCSLSHTTAVIKYPIEYRLVAPINYPGTLVHFRQNSLTMSRDNVRPEHAQCNGIAKMGLQLAYERLDVGCEIS